MTLIEVLAVVSPLATLAGVFFWTGKFSGEVKVELAHVSEAVKSTAAKVETLSTHLTDTRERVIRMEGAFDAPAPKLVAGGKR